MPKSEWVVQLTKILLMLLVGGYVIWRVETIVKILRGLHFEVTGHELQEEVRGETQFLEPVSLKEKLEQSKTLDDFVK